MMLQNGVWAMHPTKNDISLATRRKLIPMLNQALADCVDLKLQVKQAHWTVRGEHFIALHELFDKVAGSVEEYMDTIAERVQQLGGTAQGTVRVAAERSALREYPLEAETGSDHVEALSSVLAAFGANCRRAIDASTELGDAVTADMFTEIAGGLDKWLWFVESHLPASKEAPVKRVK
jgi:starvation-inducible DNA-binding protein